MSEGELVPLRLKVVPRREGMDSVPVLYSNYADVRITPEETYITFYIRLDNVADVTESEFISQAIPKQIVMLSNEHAQRLIDALKVQLDALQVLSSGENHDKSGV